MGYLFGVFGVVLFLGFSFIVMRNPRPWALAVTENPNGTKKLSASKFQALVWTLVVLFAYGSVFGSRLLKTDPKETVPAGVTSSVEEGETAEGKLSDLLPDIPLNLLVLMGLSAVTAAGAKGVTIAYKSQGSIPKEGGGLVTNPEEEGDLVKVQMLTWTLIAAGYYLLTVVDSLGAAVPSYVMPDVEGALLVLMGASQGAYIGNKLVTKKVAKTPKLKQLIPEKGSKGSSVKLLGDNFGNDQGESFVLVNGNEIESIPPEDWTDFAINFTLPADGKKGEKWSVKVNRDSEWSAETLYFELT
jgi:hypothetical protein